MHVWVFSPIVHSPPLFCPLLIGAVNISALLSRETSLFLGAIVCATFKVHSVLLFVHPFFLTFWRKKARSLVTPYPAIRTSSIVCVLLLTRSAAFYPAFSKSPFFRMWGRRGAQTIRLNAQKCINDSTTIDLGNRLISRNRRLMCLKPPRWRWRGEQMIGLDAQSCTNNW